MLILKRNQCIEQGVCVCVCSEQGVVSYEVTGQLRVASNVPWLTSVLSLLRAALELTQDLLDKVHLLSLSYTHTVDVTLLLFSHTIGESF